jgi:predicted nucleic acid-binding protein
MADGVLIDTCVWASMFSKPGSNEHRVVEQLIEEGRIVLIGPVLTEVLYGFRRQEQADWAASRLRNLGWIDVEWEDWREAAAIGRRLAAAGHRLPQTDLVIAAVARRHDLSIYSTDPHFDLFADLKRFSTA